MRKAARILFDESHSQAWTIRPDVARAMQPSHPEDSSYARAAAAAAAHDFRVAAHAEGPLTPQVLAATDVLVLAHPSEARWERVVPGGAPRLTADELDAVEAFVAGGGGLVLLAEEEQEKYGNNLQQLAARFGVGIDNALVSDYERHRATPHWVEADLASPDASGGPARDAASILARVDRACFYRSTTLDAGDAGTVLARTFPTASVPGAPLAVAVQHGAGRVVVLGDSDL